MDNLNKPAMIQWFNRKFKHTTTATNDSSTMNHHDNYHLDGGAPSLQQQEYKQYWTVQDHIVASAKLAPLLFVANYAFYASLQYISITYSTILASTGSLFTFLLAPWLRDENFHWWKLTGVALGILGSILTAKHDADTSGGGGTTNNDETSDGWNSGATFGVYSLLLDGVGMPSWSACFATRMNH